MSGGSGDDGGGSGGYDGGCGGGAAAAVAVASTADRGLPATGVSADLQFDGGAVGGACPRLQARWANRQGRSRSRVPA